MVVYLQPSFWSFFPDCLNFVPRETHQVLPSHNLSGWSRWEFRSGKRKVEHDQWKLELFPTLMRQCMGTSHEGPQLKLSLAFVVGLIVMVAESFIKLSYSMLTQKKAYFFDIWYYKHIDT